MDTLPRCRQFRRPGPAGADEEAIFAGSAHQRLSNAKTIAAVFFNPSFSRLGDGSRRLR
jgi:hypothetical protein